MKKTNVFFGNFTTKLMLALSDIFFFNISVYLSYFILYKLFDGLNNYIPQDEFFIRSVAQFVISVVCVLWFWTRLRHYTYRKPFWFELKEVLRTLVIFAVLDLALVAFSKWNFSRSVWVLSWMLIIILVPLGRALTKKILNKMGLWKKQTIIIGSGRNAFEAYAACKVKKFLDLKLLPLCVRINHAKIIILASRSLIRKKSCGVVSMLRVRNLSSHLNLNNMRYVIGG